MPLVDSINNGHSRIVKQIKPIAIETSGFHDKFLRVMMIFKKRQNNSMIGNTTFTRLKNKAKVNRMPAERYRFPKNNPKPIRANAMPMLCPTG